MMKILKDVFTIDKHPRKGLIAIEWLVLGYIVITSLFILFAYTKLDCPMEMLKGRGRVVVMIAALWAVYRHIKNEYRAIVLDNEIKLLYKKINPTVIGDGSSTLKEL
ncbi:MAG: hypothetical protein II052_00415, partial [Prevotella sp.]|nr:hypothetical protein [Prevotella sp.]